MSRTLEDITLAIVNKRQTIEKLERSLRRVREQHKALEGSIPATEADIARLRASLNDDAVELAGVADERKTAKMAEILSGVDARRPSS